MGSVRYALVAVVMCLVLRGAATVHAQATDGNGSIVTDQWLALGPFATPLGCDGNAGITGIYGNHIGPVHHIGCEAPEEGDVVEDYDPFDPNVVTDGLHPDAPQDAAGNPMWYAWEDGSPSDGIQDFELGPVPGLDEHMIYLATYIEYLGETPIVVEFCFGSDDDGQVWVDDTIVHNVTACRGAVPCDDRFFATITPGVHVIKIAAWDQGSGWGAVLGMNVDDIPVEDGDADWVFLGRDGALDLDCSPDDYEVYDRPSVSCLKSGDGSVDLSWINHPDTDPDGMITVLADGVEVATLPGGSESHTVPADLAENVTSFCVRSAAGLVACSECTKVSAEGLITTGAWIALGPFNGPGCEGTQENSIAPSFLGCEYPAVGDELRSGYDPLEAASGGLHEYAPRTADDEPIWYAFDDGTDDGDQDFNLGTPEPDNTVQYAVTYVEYTGEENPVTLNLCLGSDDTIDVWINRERVAFISACRGRATCQDNRTVTLPGAGVYRIAVGVWDGCCGWGFSLGLQDELGDPIFEDHPDWIYHGRARPADYETTVPGGTDCPSCDLRVLNANCAFGPVGFGEGLQVTWENPEDCDTCPSPIELRINGETVASVPPDAEQAGIPENLLPDEPFEVTITNCSGLFSACSPYHTDDQGLILSGAWTAIGPFLGPGCNGTRENSLAPSFIGCEYPEVGDELTEGYDPFIAASNGVHEYAVVTPDGDPVWYAFDDASNDGDQNFNLGTPEPDNVVQYAVTYIEYIGDDENVDVNLCIGNDDSIDIWVNAERVFFLDACRGREVCQETAPVTLPGPGVYRIAVGVWDGCCGWGFSLGLQDAFGLPILDDGLNEEWIFHGRSKPEGFEGPCPSCVLPVSNLTCDRDADGGVTMDWENPEGCDEDIRILLYGEEYATVPADTTSFEIPAEAITLPGAVAVDNGGLEVAHCSFIEETDEYTSEGFVKTWLMLGPFEQPSGCCPDCATAALDYLTDGEVGEADIQPVEDEEINTDFGGAAASTGLAATPGNPDLNPDGIPTWNTHTNFDDTIDYNGEWYLGDPNSVMVYSAFYVTVAEDTTVDIGIGSDDSIQVLVDGEDVGCVSAGRGAGAANEVQNVFPDVLLAAGQHLIVTKVFDGDGGHGHRLRFQRNGSAVVPGEISLEPVDAPPAGTPFRRGDANDDAAVNIADGVFILNSLFNAGGTVPPCLDATDANGDNSTNITDGVYLLNFLFQSGTEPPAPGHEECGLDPDEDELDCLEYTSC